MELLAPMHPEHASSPQRLLTRKQVAAALNVSEQTIWRMTADGRLEPPIKINSRNIRWPESAIARFIASRSTPEYAGIARDARK
jgi:predicted DNA-binding transcriptional regulator AlpA